MHRPPRAACLVLCGECCRQGGPAGCLVSSETAAGPSRPQPAHSRYLDISTATCHGQGLGIAGTPAPCSAGAGPSPVRAAGCM